MTATITTPRPRVQIPTRRNQTTIMLNVEYAGCIVKIRRLNDRYLMVTAHKSLNSPAETTVALWFNEIRDRWMGDYHEECELISIGEAQSLTEMATAAMLDTAWRGREQGAW